MLRYLLVFSSLVVKCLERLLVRVRGIFLSQIVHLAVSPLTDKNGALHHSTFEVIHLFLSHIHNTLLYLRKRATMHGCAARSIIVTLAD